MPEQNLNPDALFTVENLRNFRSIVESGTPLARNTVLRLIESAQASSALPANYSALPAQPHMSNQPDETAMRAAVEAVLNEACGNHGDLAVIAVRAYVDALSAQPGTVNNRESVVALFDGTVVRTEKAVEE